MEANGNQERGRVTPPANDGRTSPENGSIPGNPEQQDQQQDQPDPNAVLHPIYDFEGIAGPSQPDPLIDAALMGLDDDDDDAETSDRLPIIPEDQILRTSGDFNRDDGWREYLNELSMAIEEAESEVPDSPLLEMLPETIIDDLGKAKDEIKVLRQVSLSNKRQMDEYKLINEELRKKMGKKDQKIHRLAEELKECLKHRAGLEQQNTRMRQWLQTNAPDWEDDGSDSPPASPQGRTGTPVRAKRRRIHQISPSSTDSGSKRSCQQSPERLRADSPDDNVADTPDILRTPSTTPPRKRSLSDSSSNKRRRSTTPSPTVSVASVSPVALPSPILPVDTNPPGDDGGDDDGHSSNGHPGGRSPSPPRRPRAPRVRRVLGPRAGAFIPPAPANAQEQPRIWQRGPGRVSNLRPRIPLNLNVDQWFAHHLGRL